MRYSITAYVHVSRRGVFICSIIMTKKHSCSNLWFILLAWGLSRDYCSCYCFVDIFSLNWLFISWNRGLVLIQEYEFWVWLIGYLKLRWHPQKSEDNNTVCHDFQSCKKNMTWVFYRRTSAVVKLRLRGFVITERVPGSVTDRLRPGTTTTHHSWWTADSSSGKDPKGKKCLPDIDHPVLLVRLPNHQRSPGTQWTEKWLITLVLWKIQTCTVRGVISTFNFCRLITALVKILWRSFDQTETDKEELPRKTRSHQQTRSRHEKTRQVCVTKAGQSHT